MLSTQDIKHIAALARLRLSIEEERLFSIQLSDIVGFVNKLEKISNIPPDKKPTALTNTGRPDKIVSCELSTQQAIIKNAPDSVENLWRVKKII